MQILAPQTTKDIEHWEFRFVSGLTLGVDVDYLAGDTVDGLDESINIEIVPKPSPVDPDGKMAGKSYTILRSQLAYIERFVRQVPQLTPDQQAAQRALVQKLLSQAKTN